MRLGALEFTLSHDVSLKCSVIRDSELGIRRTKPPNPFN
ncbi:hypothetical protein LA76x_3931 [Lysobacter antibioticus]|uniref:Uncharacterized protein n=1 Tax=Lysobacter antibioticus TaxID=84531 RepID=A0A0S2FEV2_LYSAN|nr:hypothetical protein LA76x_3931 [Lysobacter antibioticus]